MLSFFELLIIYHLFKAYPRLATLCTESPFVFWSEEEKGRLEVLVFICAASGIEPSVTPRSGWSPLTS